MSAESDEAKKHGPALSMVISAVLGILVTVAGALIIGKLQSREPHLSYSVVTGIPFSGPTNVVSIYQVSVTNDGKKEVEGVTCLVRIPGGKIEQYKTSIAPSIGMAETVVNDALKVDITSLNPSDTATISVLASGGTSLPATPEVSIRAKGVNGEEKIGPGKKSELPVWVVLSAAIFSLLSTAVTFPFVRRTLGRIGGQAATLESICRAHGLDKEANEYAAIKKALMYWEEADRLTGEAIRTGDDAELTKAFKILTALSYFSKIADDSRAIILHDLARLEALRGNRAAADAYIQTAKLVSRSTVEPRLSTHPLPEARAGGVKHVETA